VDDGGNLLYLHRLDETQIGSIEVAIQKAQTAVHFKRPSKALAEARVANNRTPVLKLPGAIPIEGGLPIVVNEKVIRAIGVSGVTAQPDGQIAKAGVDALPKILGQETRGAPRRWTAVHWRLAGATGGGLRGMEETDASQGCSTCGLAQCQPEQ
jgi:uncharacterized protein GlcG (DUF336 family)